MMRRPALLLTLAICDTRVLDALAAELLPQGPAARPRSGLARAATFARRAGTALALLLLLGFGGFVLSSAATFGHAARSLAQAVHKQDPAALDGLVDWPQLRRRFGEDLARDARQSDWLASMGRDIADRMATASGLLPVLRARLGGGAGEARLHWTDVTQPLAPRISLGGQRPVVLTLAPRGPWSWQVVDVSLPDPAETDGFAD